MQSLRTDLMITSMRSASEKINEITSRGMQHYMSDQNLSHMDVVRLALKSAIESAKYTKDLKKIVVANETVNPFIASDDPAVVWNKLMWQKYNSRSTGFMNSGLILTLPLTPK